MNKQDNFEDNLYLLLSRIRLVRDTLALEMDPELFLNKTLDDIGFIDEILNKIQAKLLNNQRLIDKESLFNHLSELEWQFSQVLSGILTDTGSISAVKIPLIKDKIAGYRTSSLKRRETVESSRLAAAENPQEPVLSTSELNELLKIF